MIRREGVGSLWSGLPATMYVIIVTVADIITNSVVLLNLNLTKTPGILVMQAGINICHPQPGCASRGNLSCEPHLLILILPMC